MVAGNAAVTAAPLTVPFDFSKHAVGISVTVRNKQLYMLLDTGVDPSVIDLGTAEQLGLPLNRKAAGEGGGEGSGKAETMPSSIRQLKIGGEPFRDIEALATDLKNLSAIYGRRLNVVLGYSFLKDKTVLIDYPARTVTIYSGTSNGPAALSRCRKHYAARLRFLGDEHFPLMPDLRFGTLQVPATLDTGSNRMIGLYQAALQIKPLLGVLTTTGRASGAGFRGKLESATARLNVPVHVGPFSLPAGVRVATVSGAGTVKDHAANVGNETFSAMKVKLLLNYPARHIAMFSDCGR